MHNYQRGSFTLFLIDLLRTFDEAKFFDDLKDVPWDIIYIFDDTNDILTAWSDLFLEVVDANVLIKQQRVKCKNQPRWITPELLDAMKML